ncbi:MAG: glycosyltransferase family 4 protein, partial [Actinomycetota bacterium]|nr:glycosyltransferase family 4 protein [Actinomycetota bacterium]
YAFHLLWAAHVATTMELAEFDCVHAPFAAGQGSMAMFLGILIDRPLWITSHAYDIYADRIALRRKLKAARLFVTISRANRDWLVAKYGRAAQGVRVSYLGVDPRDIEYAAPQAISGPVDIVSVGSLNPKKGHDTLLRALHGLEHAGVDFKCSIIGEGAERPHLERLIEDLALGGKVTLMGSIPNDRTRQIVAASDLFVLACRHGVRGDMDGIPVALMEAMAMGVPVVSTRISGIPELVFDGDTGFLAKPGDPGSLHDALNRGIEREDVRREVSLRARALIETTFDQEANTKALLVMVVDSMRLGGE